MTKANRAESETRTNEVFKLLIAGEDSARILQYAAEKWQLSGRQTRTYIQRANARLAAHAQVDREIEYGRAISRLNALYNAAWKVKDYRVCLSVQRELGNLLRLSAPPPPTPPVTLQTPGDVLTIVQGELSAVLRGESTPERTRQVETLATLALRAVELTTLADRIAALENAAYSPQGIGNGNH